VVKECTDQPFALAAKVRNWRRVKYPEWVATRYSRLGVAKALKDGKMFLQWPGSLGVASTRASGGNS